MNVSGIPNEAGTALVPAGPARAVEDEGGPVKVRWLSPLTGIRIPSRNVNARNLTAAIYEANPHLTRADLFAVVRYAELCWKFRRLAEYMERLPESGVVRQDAEPRKLLAELRATADVLLRHEAALAITSAARAGLGLDIALIKQLISVDGRPGKELQDLSDAEFATYFEGLLARSEAAKGHDLNSRSVTVAPVEEEVEQ
jgi:hypothetical protein